MSRLAGKQSGRRHSVEGKTGKAVPEVREAEWWEAQQKGRKQEKLCRKSGKQRGGGTA